MKIAIEQLKLDERGLIPVIVQDARTRQVLMLASMNAESLKKTVETNETWFWSRSRSGLWHKGETSGNTQRVVDILSDCDGDALTVLVVPNGPACHTGAQSCFFNEIQDVRPCEDAAGQDRGSQAGSPLGVVDPGNLGEVLNILYALVESRRRE
jgi:phosphoribosyl-ATP pyrophosphohydrolase/phosphoribosyl-AMP cyclohydrolase